MATTITSTHPTADAVRDEVRSWIEQTWRSDLTLRQWWKSLADAGWAFPHWPAGAGGRGLPAPLTRIVGDELSQAGAVAPPFGLGQLMGGPVVIDFGTDAQREAWLRPLATGQEAWCQLFSEPGAGSDLASVQTRAVRDGDVWILNGQKVWTSGARTADRGMLVARTNVDAPKHRGITYFIIDMDQPGIDVRPLKQMNGSATFNEVFFADAVVPADRVIGEVDGGWRATVATLAYERQGLGGRGGERGGVMAGAPGEKAGLLDEPVGKLLESAARSRQEAATQRAARSPSALQRLAREHGRAGDPVIRQRLAAMHAFAEAQRMTTLRSRAAAAKGREPGAEVSTGKLAMSELARQTRDIGMEVLGAHGMLDGDDAPNGGTYQQAALSAHASSIAGGTDEIQRNIIGERVLGLPKEPQIDRDVPFKDLKVGTQRNSDT